MVDEDSRCRTAAQRFQTEGTRTGKDIEDSGTAQAAAVFEDVEETFPRTVQRRPGQHPLRGLQDPSSGTAGYDSHRITCSYIVNYTRFLLHINLFFLNSFDLQFLAVHEADNVVFMAHDDQQGCQQAENRQRQRFV